MLLQRESKKCEDLQEGLGQLKRQKVRCTRGFLVCGGFFFGELCWNVYYATVGLSFLSTIANNSTVFVVGFAYIIGPGCSVEMHLRKSGNMYLRLRWDLNPGHFFFLCKGFNH